MLWLLLSENIVISMLKYSRVILISKSICNQLSQRIIYQAAGDAIRIGSLSAYCHLLFLLSPAPVIIFFDLYSLYKISILNA